MLVERIGAAAEEKEAVSLQVRVVRLPHAADLPLPQYQSAQAAGLDLLAAVPADAPVELAPGGRAMIPTGVAIALPRGHRGPGAAALGPGRPCTASPCLTLPARSMPTTAENCR